MADLEELALKRDRAYLVRLVLGLAAAVVASVFLFRGLTGGAVSGCVADAFLGQDGGKAGAPAAAAQPSAPR